MFISFLEPHLSWTPQGGAVKDSSRRQCAPRRQGRGSHLRPGTQGAALSGKRCHGRLRLWERHRQGLLCLARLNCGIAAALRCYTLLLGLAKASGAFHSPPTFSPLALSIPSTSVGLRLGSFPSSPPAAPPLFFSPLPFSPLPPPIPGRPGSAHGPPLPTPDCPARSPSFPLAARLSARPPSRPLPTPTGSGLLGLGPRPAPFGLRHLLPAARPGTSGLAVLAAALDFFWWRAGSGTGQV